MIMPRGTHREAMHSIVTAPEAHCTPSGVSFTAEGNRLGVDHVIARSDDRIDLAPCSADCDRPCARSRRALSALLAANSVGPANP